MVHFLSAFWGVSVLETSRVRLPGKNLVFIGDMLLKQEKAAEQHYHYARPPYDGPADRGCSVFYQILFTYALYIPCSSATLRSSLRDQTTRSRLCPSARLATVSITVTPFHGFFIDNVQLNFNPLRERPISSSLSSFLTAREPSSSLMPIRWSTVHKALCTATLWPITSK